jgi:hypothetical protein
MIKITAIKDNKFAFGNVTQIASLVGCTYKNLYNHYKDETKIIININNWIIYLRSYE